MNSEEKVIMEFIEQYNAFNKWLLSIGFKSIPSNTQLDYHYSYYNKHIDSLSSVEHYRHTILETSIRFLRDRNEPIFYVIAEDETYSIQEFKEYIFNLLTNIKNEKIEKLNSINITL